MSIADDRNQLLLSVNYDVVQQHLPAFDTEGDAAIATQRHHAEIMSSVIVPRGQSAAIEAYHSPSSPGGADADSTTAAPRVSPYSSPLPSSARRVERSIALNYDYLVSELDEMQRQAAQEELQSTIVLHQQSQLQGELGESGRGIVATSSSRGGSAQVSPRRPPAQVLIPRRAEAFRAWQLRRAKVRPTEQEDELRAQLNSLAERRRHRNARIARMDGLRAQDELERQQAAERQRLGIVATNNENTRNSPSSQQQSRGSVRAAAVDDEGLLSTAIAAAAAANAKSTFELLPFEVRAKVYEYLPVVPPYMLDDVRFICTFLPTDDALPLHDPQTAQEAFDFAERCIDEHKKQFASTAVVALVLGLSDRKLAEALFSGGGASVAGAPGATAGGTPNLSRKKQTQKEIIASIALEAANADGAFDAYRRQQQQQQQEERDEQERLAVVCQGGTEAGGGASAGGGQEQHDNQHQRHQRDNSCEGVDDDADETTSQQSEGRQRALQQQTTSATKKHESELRCSVPHLQRREYSHMLSMAVSELQRQRHILDLCRRWSAFEKTAVETPCSVLRIVLRECLESWTRRVVEMRRTGASGTVCELLSASIESMRKQVKAVEYVGSAKTELEDVRDMLWDARWQHLPAGVNADYARSLTLGQIVSLGISEVPWVRGFAWQDRSSGVISREEVDITKMMAIFPDLAVLRELSLDALVDTEAVIAARHAESQRIADEERVARAEARVSRVRSTAVDALARRVFQEHGKPQPFGSCDMCGSIHVHWVGLSKALGAATSDTAICEICYREGYEEIPLMHRQFDWQELRELLEEQAQEEQRQRQQQVEEQ